MNKTSDQNIFIDKVLSGSQSQKHSSDFKETSRSFSSFFSFTTELLVSHIAVSISCECYKPEASQTGRQAGEVGLDKSHDFACMHANGIASSSRLRCLSYRKD